MTKKGAKSIKGRTKSVRGKKAHAKKLRGGTGARKGIEVRE